MLRMSSFFKSNIVLSLMQLWQSMQSRGEFLRPGGKTEEEWAKHSYVQLNTLQEVHKLVEELMERLKRVKITVLNHQSTSRKEQTLILKVCMFLCVFTVCVLHTRDVLHCESCHS